MTTRYVRLAGAVLGIMAITLTVIIAIGIFQYGFEYVFRVVTWGSSDVSDYMNNFPQRRLVPAPTPYTFTERLEDERLTATFEQVLGVASFDDFMQESATQAFIVLQDGEIIYEHYFNGARRDTLTTSFSMAKSFVTALVGIAIDDGAIGSVADPITAYLPELAKRDSRFAEIKIADLVKMAAGVDYQDFRLTLWNSDDILSTYYPDQRQAALEFTQIVAPPGEYFLYNKYYPQLLGLILERATGMSVTEFTQQRLWNPLGMEYGGSWSLDSQASGFEKMETGLNARPIDYAKFGQLYLNGGIWDEVQVISSKWVADSTQLDPSTYNQDYYAVSGQTIYGQLGGYYSYMWWGMLRGEAGYDFSALGDHGQIIYVAPSKNLVIVRIGYEWGFSGSDDEASTKWWTALYEFVTQY